MGNPNGDTGVVTGTITATDTEGDVLTFSGPAVTDKGSLSVNSSTGVFTYTPSPGARHAALAVGATAADKTDTFLVLVADGRGGKTSVTVTVSIAPGVNAVLANGTAG